MIVLNSEQIMRAESEHGARSTELHGCYRRLLLEFPHPSEVCHLHFMAILKSFSCKLSTYMYTLLLKAAIPFIQI